MTLVVASASESATVPTLSEAALAVLAALLAVGAFFGLRRRREAI